MSRFSLDRLRPGHEDIRSAFEEFCCQLFHRAPEAPTEGHYQRIRGAGGDGGVEALWKAQNGKVWGLQAKFFHELKTSQKKQMKESLDQAVANYPTLDHYTFCLPFNFTGKKGAKSGKPVLGEHDKLADWRGEWTKELLAKGRQVTIDLWDKSELLSRLADCDPSGGLCRYWFDQTVLSQEWLANHLKEAKTQAGERYSPELSLETPLVEALDSFGVSGGWASRIEDLSEALVEKLGRWRVSIHPAKKSMEGKLPENLVDEGRALLTSVEMVVDNFQSVINRPDILTDGGFRSKVKKANDLTIALEPKVKSALENIHGAEADTMGFRQYSAEFMVSFPMAPLDHLRDLRDVLHNLDNLVSGIQGALPTARVMLVHGPAGVGKTHGVLDIARARYDQGLPSVIVFGEDFGDEIPWTRLALKIGLSATTGSDELLDALDAMGETAGFPLVIFLDALNETTPDRRCWQTWLPPMAEQIGRRSFLKLCVTCRDTYLREVIPDHFTPPSFEHNGFAGREHDAIFRFFQHYGLGLPVEPLLQEEFSNPLFLHLVCEALRDTGESAIPSGREGISAVIKLLLHAKNDKAAVECDYDPRAENRVYDAILALANVMARNGSRKIPLSGAREVVDSMFPAKGNSTSLFNILERESLISVIKQKVTEFGSPPAYDVRFTFEWEGDYFIAERLIAQVNDENLLKVFAEEGPLHFLVVDKSAAAEHAGLLEALSIQIAEHHGYELVELSDLDSEILSLPILKSLQWRHPDSITRKTVDLVKLALGSHVLIADAWEVLLKVSTRPSHPLNARFLDEEVLSPQPMLMRDPPWAFELENSFLGSKDHPQEGVSFRLIEWALRGELDGLDEDVAVLWAFVLAWFCASPNRRIRDRATKGLVRIFRARPVVIRMLFSRFLSFEDEYIAERVLVAGYGALLLNPHRDHIRAAASEVYAQYFFSQAVVPLNASLRDHGRLLLELAADTGSMPEGVSTAMFRPPYDSPWPISLPSESDVAEFVDDTKRFPRMDLTEKAGLATGTDFARYIIHPRVTNKFDISGAGLNELGLFRWFLKEAVNLGYPGPNDLCAEFDRMLLGKYGGGRGRPGWAERLGKKYYWIFFRRLVGQIADHVPQKDREGQFHAPSSYVQALGLRDIDPTDIRLFDNHFDDAKPDWFEGNPYVFSSPNDPAQDKAWVKADDLPDVSGAIDMLDPEGNAWHVLSLPSKWNDNRRIDKTYRHFSRVIRAVLGDVGALQNVENVLSDEWIVDLLNFLPYDYRGYIGEYPHGWLYRQRIESDIFFRKEVAGLQFEAVALQQLKGAEWGYDYSVENGSPSLLMPTPLLINFGNLKWDGRGSWVDPQGVVQVMDPFWKEDVESALIIRLDFLDKLMNDTNKFLLLIGFQSKSVLGGFSSNRVGMIEELTVFVRHDGQTRERTKMLKHF